jgi:8-oxo-dGTP diphosphatase
VAAPKTPPVAADVIIELIDRPGRPIVLIERRFPPPGWALPGGFVEVGETVEAACVREAAEETSLDVEVVRLVGVYSDPGRDPRGHTVGVTFLCRLAGGVLRGADDAAEARWFGLDALPQLAFDHAAIVADVRALI